MERAALVYGLLERKDERMKALSVSLTLGMMVVLLLLCGYWLRTPYAITAQWDYSGDRGLEPEDLMRYKATR